MNQPELYKRAILVTKRQFDALRNLQDTLLLDYGISLGVEFHDANTPATIEVDEGERFLVQFGRYPF